MAQHTARRRVLPLFAFALLGLISTIGAVAWSALRPLAATTGQVASDGNHIDPWLLRTRTPFAERTVFFEKRRIYSVPGAGPAGARSCAVSSWSFASSTRNKPGFTPGTFTLPATLEAERQRTMPNGFATYWGMMRERRGFPFLAFECDVVAPNDASAPGIWEVRSGALLETAQSQTSVSLFSLRVLPLRPIWSGLLANTLCWALAWILAWRLTSTAIGRLRRKKGHCPRCAYDLTGARERCPECGWQLTPAVRAELGPTQPTEASIIEIKPPAKAETPTEP
jgi:hypothetical protein